MHAALGEGKTGVVTGGASGIGLEIARRLVGLGMKVAIADLGGARLDAAAAELEAPAPGRVLAVETDIGDDAAVLAMRDRVLARFGAVEAVFANAGMQPGSSIFDAEQNWRRIIDVNMWGVIRTAQAFAPGMIASARPGLIVNTGSKQGITTPPGDPAYNVSKSGVKTFTEALQHDLRKATGDRVEARLFIPGFVFTPLTSRGRTEKPAGAWTPSQAVDFLFDALSSHDLYILRPDNEVDRATDEKRILWAAMDITENRQPLSRWHGAYDDAFRDWLKK